MNIPNRRKACQIETQKQTYLGHINRLQQLRKGKSPQHARQNRQHKKLLQTINTVRRMHTYSRIHREKQKKEQQKQTKQINFNKIKSVVLNDFNWLIPLMPPKHKRNKKQIHNQNFQIFKRILHTKSNIDSKNKDYQQRKQKIPLPCINFLDFSKIYQASQLHTNPHENNHKLVKIKFGKGKKCTKYKLQINTQQLFDRIKDINTLYYIQLYYSTYKCRTNPFILQQLTIMKIIVKIADKQILNDGNIFVKIVKILDGNDRKQLCKARLYGNICANIQVNEAKQIVQRKQQQQGGQREQAKKKQLSILSSISNTYNTYNTTGHTPRNIQLLECHNKQGKLNIVKLKLQKIPNFLSFSRYSLKQDRYNLTQPTNKNSNLI